MMQVQVGRSFHLALMIAITAVVLYGFSHTVDADIIHPAQKQPLILYVHVAVFTTWLLVLMTQTALIWARNPRLHRTLGWCAVGFAAGLVAVGLATTVAMGRVQVERMGPEAGFFIYRPLADVVFFCAAFGLAIHWRRRPDFHCRLMVLAACALTPPAISRIPGVPTLSMVYLGTDLLVLAAILHDLVTLRRVHAVYRWGVGIGAAGQFALLLVMSTRPEPFAAFAHFVTQ